MKEELVELVSLNKKNIENSIFKNEDETKQSLILSVLNRLGWDVFNIKEVIPEYGIEGKRVDYCLSVNNKTKIFIEVKKTSENIDKHQKQLLEYSFSHGIELSVLTNGIDWWFYLPLKPKPWEERIYCEVDVSEDKITDVVDNFIKYLSKERVSTGESLKLAHETYENKSKIQTVEETIPRVWNGIITELLENKENSLLYDLISDGVKNQCRINPQPQSIIDFIQSHRERFSIDEKPIVISKKKSKGKSSKPSSVTLKKSINGDYYGKKVKSFTFDGKKQDVKLWKDVLVGLCEMIYKKHSKEFTKVFEIKGKKNPYFVKKSNLVSKPKLIPNSGIYVETNFSSVNIVKKCNDVLDKFGYSSKDFELECQTQSIEGVSKKKPKPVDDKENTSSLVLKKIGEKFKSDLVEFDIKGGRKKYYTTIDKKSNFLILTSRQYDNGKKGYGYWYSLRLNQIQFLTENKSSYIVLVCGSSKTVFLQMWDDFKLNIEVLNSSGEGDKMYYHIKTFERDSKILLGLPDVGNSKDVTEYFI